MRDEHHLPRALRSPAKGIAITMATGLLLVFGGFLSCESMVSSHVGVGDRAVGPFVVTSCVGLVVFFAGCFWGLLAFLDGRL
jgi:hypothetical protein